MCDPHNSQDIAEKIIWVFSNEEKAKLIGKNAREFVIMKYGLDYIIERNIEFFIVNSKGVNEI
ncbi:hypothetical protein D3C86_1952150 [compost metagenome]